MTGDRWHLTFLFCLVYCDCLVLVLLSADIKRFIVHRMINFFVFKTDSISPFLKYCWYWVIPSISSILEKGRYYLTDCLSRKSPTSVMMLILTRGFPTIWFYTYVKHVICHWCKGVFKHINILIPTSSWIRRIAAISLNMTIYFCSSS